jgi:predicted HTH transcriptional regulator
MGNLRDGGIVIVGLSERDRTWDCSGVLDEHANTFDPDVVIEQINAYVSPHVDLDVVLVLYQGKNYLAISVHEFEDTPLVCKKNGSEGLQEGHVYIRPTGRARTTKVTDARQMHDLLEVATEKRARKLLETARRIGLAIGEAGPSENDKFDAELRDL